MRPLSSLAIGIALIATACGSTTGVVANEPLLVSPTSPAHVAGQSGDVPEEPPEERTLFAGVNIAIADVPLDEVVFDTFDGGSITLAEASEEQVLGLLNAIPPLDDPNYMAGADADWLADDDLVLGYVAEDGTAWAHPHRVLNFHEIVNIELAGRPVAITYCPLCGSGVVFDRRPNDLRHQGTLTFDNTSALYENDMVMVDAETNTYWWQVAGRGIVGNLTGSELVSLPSTTTTWATWLSTHPDTQVLSNDQGRGPTYERDPFVDYGTRVDAGRVPFPVGPAAFADERLSPSTRVIGFEIDGDYAAVPVLANEPTAISIPAADAANSLVVFLDGAGGGSLFRSNAGWTAGPDGFTDDQGETWDRAGRRGDGSQLEAVPSRTALWFAWISTTAGDTRLFTPTGEIPSPG